MNTSTQESTTAMSRLLSFLKFIFGIVPETREISEPIKKLLYSINVTTKTRYNASVRLLRQSTISFLTSTILSLGLILIPLLQSSDIHIAYSLRTTNMIQVFLAVAVLVYTIVSSKANYNVRAEKLNICGDKLKELGRDLDEKIRNSMQIDYHVYHDKYNDITRDSENHIRNDYRYTRLQMHRHFNIVGMKRLSLYFIYLLTDYVWTNLLSFSLITLEVIFILDIIGITSILTQYFK